MKLFLQEAWEIWYWAMFCPSKLQERMNVWGGSEDNTLISFEILLLKESTRFISRYLLVLLVLCLPLLVLILSSGKLVNGWLIPVAGLVAYGISIFSIPIGIHWPLLFALVFGLNPNFYQQVLQRTLKIFLPFPRLFISLGVGVLILSLLGRVMVWMITRKRFLAGRIILTIGGGLGIGIGSWLVTHNGGIALFMAVAIMLCIFLLWRELKLEDYGIGGFAVGVALIIAVGVALVTNDFTVSVAGSIAGGIAAIVAGIVMFGVVGSVAVNNVIGIFKGSVAVGISVGVVSGIVGGVAGGVAGVVAGSLSNISPMFFIVTSSLISFSLAPLKQRWLWSWIAGVLGLLGIEHLGAAILMVFPIILVFYYRILPDYLFASILSLLTFSPLWRARKQEPTVQTDNAKIMLRWLPPYTTEILWLPLPCHDRWLSMTFQSDPDFAWKTIQKMQVLALPGFQSTLKRALPQIISEQFMAVSTISEIQSIRTSKHPWLPLLAPFFYLSESEQNDSASVVASPLVPELFRVLPQVLGFSKNIDVAMQVGNIPLRKRFLESTLNDLTLFLNQLPGLVKPEAVNRWGSVVNRWNQILQREIDNQHTQKEFLNPFVYGNPLAPNIDYIFKGRQSFADQIVRLILDRNRPTLMLYGPRRCGKSSFLLNLPRLLPSDLIPIFLDLQSAAFTTDDAGFCQGLVRAIHRDSRSQGIAMPNTPARQDFLENPYITLETWLESALPSLGDDRRLLLNLDEFEKIGSAIKVGKLTEDLFNELRHLIQHYDQLGFLFSGVQTLDEIGPNWSSYFISIIPMEMLYLEPDEAYDLLTNPGPDFSLRYDTDVIDQILTLTRGQPYLLQLIGSALVDQANQKQTQLVTPDLLQSAIQSALTLGEPYFTNVWTEFTGQTDVEQTAGQTYLQALAKDTPLTPTNPELHRKCRQRMLRYHVIEETEVGDRIEIPLVAQWVRERSVVQ